MMASNESSLNQGKYRAELRIVLLGGQNSGKSLVGNAILTQEEFTLHEQTSCLRRNALVRGRNMVVVYTPGWWCDFSTSDTPELIKRELKHSIALSLPGPHVFLLVVKTDSGFNEKRRRAVEEHLELLGETVWGHTLVLFTKGRLARDDSFEDQASGRPLQWLLKKCNGRFQVFHGQETSNSTQILQLMEKMDQMVKDKLHFIMDVKILQEVEDRKREVELKAHQRLTKMQGQRAALKELSTHHHSIRIVLLGAKSSGKSSTGNRILTGIDQSFSTNKRTCRCKKKTVTEKGREVTVVDTPGWWMNYFIQDSSAFDKEELLRCVYMCPPGPHAFLLIVRVDRCFTETYRRAFEEHAELVKKDVWNQSMVLFTFGDWLRDTTIEQYIESEGKALQWLVERCGNRYHVLNNKHPGNSLQITELLEKIEEMQVGNGARAFEADEKLFKVMKRKLEDEESRATLRRELVLRRREHLKAFKGQVPLPSSIQLLLLGAKHSGKTSSASSILGTAVEEAEAPIKGTAVLNETKVEVMDTPGWTTNGQDHTESSRKLLSDIVPASASQTCVLLLVLNASSSFTVQKLRAAEHHLRSLGGNTWSRAIVLFTNGDWLGDVSIERRIESEGDALRVLVEKCGNRYHVFDNKNKDKEPQTIELMLMVKEMMVEQMMSSGDPGNAERPLGHEELRFRRRVVSSGDPGNVERPLGHEELCFNRRVGSGKGKNPQLKKPANVHHGKLSELKKRRRGEESLLLSQKPREEES